MTVSVGQCNGSQECIFYAGYNEPNCYSNFYSASTATWRTEEGVTYYILVQGSDSADVGEFALSVTSFETSGNDDCFGAVSITANGTLITGSTAGATYDSSLTYCSGYPSPDMWYSVAGTGGELTASTCNSVTNYDSALSVYASFSGDCSELRCETSNDDACDSTTSELSWFSDAGLTYFVRVHGFGSSAGNFGLTVSGDGNPPGGGPPGGDGDSCSSAIFITAADGALIQGSTSDASFSGISDCSGYPSPDRWYVVQGTGSPMTASLCQEETNFDTFLSVYLSIDGACTSAFRCLDANDDSTCGTASELVWDTEISLFYYLRVHGFGNNTGNFGLRVFGEIQAEGDGGSCDTAVPIPFPDGSLILASTSGQSSGGTDDCSGFDGPGVWYIIFGTGEEVTASTCNSDTDFDSYLSLFVSGDRTCGSVRCLTSNDDNCGSTTSEVTWFAESGEIYYLHVHGFGGSSGSYGLTISGSGVENNDECEGATELDPFQVNFILGDTSLATNSGASSCGGASVSSSPDLWYSVEGTDARMVATTCNEFTFFDTQISVYQGSSCFALNCLDGNDDSCSSTRSTVEWFAQSFTSYFIRVHGYDNRSAGPFELSVGPADQGFNDHCESAIPTNPFSTYSGTTVGATPDALVASCGGATAVVANGVWYTVVGTGSPLVASTCEGTNFDTQISVFVGFGCSELECVDGSDQHCGDQSLVEFDTFPGFHYYILVHGYLGSYGDFTLSIYSDVEETIYKTTPSWWENDDDQFHEGEDNDGE
jgi:hypothetical protein